MATGKVVITTRELVDLVEIGEDRLAQIEKDGFINR
jgi:hypothetical protein